MEEKKIHIYIYLEKACSFPYSSLTNIPLPTYATH